MKEQFQHKVTNSLLLWFDNYLLTHGEAYTLNTGVFTYYADNQLDPKYKAYGSQFKQWVNDSSITEIPSGVYINGGFSGRNDGVVLDFENGRVLVETSDTNLSITGSFPVKEINVYYCNEDEDDLLIENKFKQNSRIPSLNPSYITPYDQVVPAIFVTTQSQNNTSFAFGGMEETSIYAKAVVMAEDPFQLEGILSIFSDSKNESITPIPISGHPQTEYGDIKDGSYSYTDLKNQYSTPNGYYIQSANTSKLTDSAKKALKTNLFIGFIDLEIQQHRYRHQ